MTDEFSKNVEKHWHDDEAGSLLARIDRGLRESGKVPENLTADDLHAVDEFHIRGREATEELANLAHLDDKTIVLDVGSGIGGPSRFIAGRYGCHVTGIDLTAEYCDTASALAGRIGLGERVQYRQADALELPFEDASFDLVWTQHISMNIPDKKRMFGEMARVVKPGGCIAIYDPICGSGEPITFPVPWSRDGAISFLINADETRSLLESLGLVVETWNDVSEKSLAWFKERAASAEDEPPPLGLQLLLGSDWPTMARNMVQGIAEGKITVVQVIARRPIDS
jgi:SAM-dependent methyltransferase